MTTGVYVYKMSSSYYVLQLHNFGCHQNLSVTLVDDVHNRRVCLEGNSGCGKSTVLESVLFVLTENHAVKFLPWSNKGAVWVCLAYYDNDNNLKWMIKRGRRPNVLEVTEGGYVYQKEVAEGNLVRSYCLTVYVFFLNWMDGGYYLLHQRRIKIHC